MKLLQSAAPMDWFAAASRDFLKTRWKYGFVCLAVMPALAGLAQTSSASAAPDVWFHQRMTQLVDNREQSFDANARMLLNADQAKRASFAAVNAERMRQLDSDSAMILRLASELKAEIDMAPQNTLSLSAMRKAQEIERLAHIVQLKMKLTVGAD